MKYLKLLIAVVACLGTSSCAVLLGAHTHEWEHAGQTYVKCTIVSTKGDTKLVDHAIEVCRDAFQTPTQPQRH